MKPGTLYLFALLLVIAAFGHVRSSDSDSDFYMTNEGFEPDVEMTKFNEKLDHLADVTQRSYQKRLAIETEKARKVGKELDEASKKKIFKECFQKKFDYAKLEVGKTGSFFDIGNDNIFDLGDSIAEDSKDL